MLVNTTLQRPQPVLPLKSTARSRPFQRRSNAIQTQALFNFLPGGATKAIKVSPKTKQLVDELLELSQDSNIGTKLSRDDKATVEELVWVCAHICLV